MIDRQSLARNAPASALLLACLFLAISLAGYDPADRHGANVHPPNASVANPCGPVGASIAHGLVTSLGWSSWLLLYALFAIDLLWFRRVPIREKGVRAVGLGLLLLVAATFSHKLGSGLTHVPPVGAGGYLGGLFSAILEGQVGLAGMLLLLSFPLVVGLSLAVDALFVLPAQELIALVRLALVLIRRRGPATDAMEASPPSRMVSSPGLTVVGTETLPLVPIGTAPLPERPRPILNPSTRGLNQPPAEPRPPAARTSQPAIPYDGAFQLPPLELLEPAPPFPIQEHEAKISARAMLLERTLLDFGYQVRVVQIDTGPVITQFEIELEAGLRVSRIIGLADDLAIALAVPSVRIVAPIPGKTTVGIEVPNDRRGMVKLGEVISVVNARHDGLKIPLFLGKDVKGIPLAFDLADMPHLLIAGRTGTGKSVCLNAMILSILMTKRPDEVKLILIDPKMVELSQFKRIPHLMHPVVTDMKKAESLLSWACDKMDERYTFLARAGVRNIQTYNQLGPDEIFSRLRPEDDAERARIPTFMPYIVIIADEMADLMMTAAKEVEGHIVRLAQKARAVGMHLIVATQKPTVDVITGLIKGNLPARIAFQVASRGDSRVVLDEMGADRLLGNGDMLFLFPGTSHIVRAQGTYVSDLEVNRVTQYLEQYPVEFSRELVQLQVSGGPGGKERGAGLKERDELYESAIEIIIREGRGSCSLLQRAMGIGYGRAARLIDFMAEDGIVGEFKSGSAREVLYTWDEWEALKNGGDSADTAA
jgi:S-DNA-T family DNA segregation ATPase FtsK/SpoIIIE